MTNAIETPLSASPYFDLHDGTDHSITRARQLNQILRDEGESNLWPLIIVNLASCLEWFARSAIKQLIDYSADRVNPEARLLRELKINYALILQSHTNQFSIGDIVALSRNFSSFEDIDSTIKDILRRSDSSLLDRLREIFESSPYPNGLLSEQLKSMFIKRHELVHGTPRYLSYENEMNSYITRKELAVYAHCCIAYMRNIQAMLRKHVPELNARTTMHINANQFARLENSERQIEKLEKAIERRIDPEHVSEFRKAQRAWRLWRGRESSFQSIDWLGGTGRPAVYLGYETSFNMQRIRQLEAYLREFTNA